MKFLEETAGRLLAKLVRDVLRGETFACLADLTDAVKYRCVRLRIRWTPDGITDAFRLVGSNAALCRPPVPVTRPAADACEPPGLSHAESLACLAQAQARLTRAVAPRTMAAVRRLSDREGRAWQFRRDQHRAMAIVETQMLESLRRCEALEQAIRDEAGVA